MDILVGCKRIFLKDLKLPVDSYFCRPDRIILSQLKKIKKIEFFFRRWVWISVWCKLIILKDLKLPINPYFYRPDQVIKKKKNNNNNNNNNNNINLCNVANGRFQCRLLILQLMAKLLRNMVFFTVLRNNKRTPIFILSTFRTYLCPSSGFW